MFATMRSKSETVPPRLSGTGTNAFPIAAYAGRRLESPPEWQTSTRLPRRSPIFLSTSRADALSARIRHDDDVVRESSAQRRDDRPVSLCLRRVRGRHYYEVVLHLLVAATSPAP